MWSWALNAHFYLNQNYKNRAELLCTQNCVGWTLIKRAHIDFWNPTIMAATRRTQIGQHLLAQIYFINLFFENIFIFLFAKIFIDVKWFWILFVIIQGSIQLSNIEFITVKNPFFEISEKKYTGKLYLFSRNIPHFFAYLNEFFTPKFLNFLHQNYCIFTSKLLHFSTNCFTFTKILLFYTNFEF